MGTRGQIIFLIALTVAIYLGSAFRPPLFDDADSVHAEAAREMLVRHDWVTLHANGIRYLEKAPLPYWAMAVSFKLLGVWEMPARLPLVIGAVLFTLLLYAFGSRLGGPRAGFYAGLAGPTAFGVYLFTRITIPDLFVALLLTATNYCFLVAIGDLGPPPGRAKRALWWYAMYATIAFAVLSKGLIGVVFPAGIAGIYLIVTRRLTWDVVRSMRLVSGSLLFLAIAAPWHILAGLRNDKFFWFYFVNEHFNRYIGTRVPPDYDKVPLLLFWGLHVAWIFPWTPFLALAVRDLRRLSWTAVRGGAYLEARSAAGVQAGAAPISEITPTWTSAPRENAPAVPAAVQRPLAFLWIWAGLIVLFFSFSTRQEYYTFPAYPALILLIAYSLAVAERRHSRGLGWCQGLLLAAGLASFSVLAVMIGLSFRTHPTGDISETLTRNPQYYALSLGHFFDLTPESFADLRLPAIGAAIAFLAGPLLGFVFRRRKKHRAATAAIALTSALFFLAAHGAMETFGPYMSSKPLAVALRPVLRDADRIVINGEYESGSTLNFYTGRQVYILNGRSSNLWWGSFYPDAPHIFLGDPDIVSLWHSPGRVFLFTQDEDRPRLERLLGPTRVFAESGGKSILVNR